MNAWDRRHQNYLKKPESQYAEQWLRESRQWVSIDATEYKRREAIIEEILKTQAPTKFKKTPNEVAQLAIDFYKENNRLPSQKDAEERKLYTSMSRVLWKIKNKELKANSPELLELIKIKFKSDYGFEIL